MTEGNKQHRSCGLAQLGTGGLGASVTEENRHLTLLQPGDDPDFGVAAQSPLQGVVGLKVTAVQTGVLGFLASSPTNLQAQHVSQAVHYLDQSPADAGLPEQKDIIAAVVELLGAVSGRPADSGVIGLYCFGKSWLHTRVEDLGAKL